MQKSAAPESLKNIVIILKEGPAMKKQSRLHNYAPVTLVLTSCSIMYFHDRSNPKPACTIPLSAVISACIVTEPSISIYHGVSQDCSFLVSIGDRSFKFRVDAAATATSWAAMIMSAKNEQIRDVGENNPFFIDNTSGDNSDGTKFWRTTPVGYVENFNAAIDSISSVLPAALTGNKSIRERDTSGLSRRQIEALLTFETLICLNEMIVQRTANAFFDALTARSRSNQEGRLASEECRSIGKLLGHSIGCWLVGVDTLPTAGSTPTTCSRWSAYMSEPTNVFSEKPCSNGVIGTSPSRDDLLSVTATAHSTISMQTNSTETEPLPIPKSQISQMQEGEEGLKPSKNLILHYWIESCILHEFQLFSSRSIIDDGTLSSTANMLFQSGSNTGLFIA